MAWPVEAPDLPGQPVVYGRNQPQYRRLPARQVGSQVYTRWQFNFEERRALLDGGRLCISEMYTVQMQTAHRWQGTSTWLVSPLEMRARTDVAHALVRVLSCALGDDELGAILDGACLDVRQLMESRGLPPIRVFVISGENGDAYEVPGECPAE